jgi:hypothetical protein
MVCQAGAIAADARGSWGVTLNGGLIESFSGVVTVILFDRIPGWRRMRLERAGGFEKARILPG